MKSLNTNSQTEQDNIAAQLMMKHNVMEELHRARQTELRSQQRMESAMTQSLAKLEKLEAQLTADALQAINVRGKLAANGLSGIHTS